MPSLLSNVVLVGWWVILGTASPVAAQSGRVDSVVADSLTGITLPPELDRVLRDYEAGWRSRDAEALAALFAPDGYIMRPGHKPVKGREAIAEAYEDSGGPLVLRAFYYSIADSVGYILGGYSHAADQPDSGKYILTLRQMDDGRWYITADMDNSNR